MATATVTGDPDGIRSAGRGLGGRAHAADGQARQITLASDTVGLHKFQGGAADRVRGFLGSLAHVSTEISRAYERVATELPRVADAVHDAQAAERVKDRADKALTEARSDVASAQAALAAAQAALAAARAKAAVATLVTHQHVSTAAQEHAVHEAKAKLDKAQDKEREAARDAKKAQHEFDEADRARDRASRRLAQLAQGIGTTVAGMVGGLPDAPMPPAAVGQLGILGYGQGFFKTAFDLTEALARADIGLGRLGGLPVHGPLTEEAARTLASVDRIARFAKYADNGLTVGLPLLSHTITAFSDKRLNRMQRLQEIFGPSAVEAGMAYGAGAAGTALCGPACGWAASTVGGKAGEHVAKIKTVRSVTDAAVHDYVAEKIKPFEDLYHGRIKDAAVDALLADSRVAYNVGKRGYHVITHPGDDAKFVYQAAKDVHHEAATVSSVVPGDPVGVVDRGFDGAKDITQGHVGRGVVKIVGAPVTAPLNQGKKLLDGIGIHI